MNRKIVKILVLCFCFMIFGAVAFAQDPCLPEDEPCPPPPPGLPPPGLPIDGGLSFLLISGVAYGIFELKRKK